MNSSDDDASVEQFGGVDGLAKFTSDAVENAMHGFALPLENDTDFSWLGIATYRALETCKPEWDERSDRLSDAEQKAQLEHLSSVAQSTWRQLFDRSREVDDRLHRLAFGVGTQNSQRLPSDHDRFERAIRELEWAASFMRDAARSVIVKPGPWTTPLERQLRISRARHLAPIFEFAFATKVKANNYPSDPRFKRPTPFMDFYERIMILAYDRPEASDLSGVIKEACRLHRKEPVVFSSGRIPGL